MYGMYDVSPALLHLPYLVYGCILYYKAGKCVEHRVPGKEEESDKALYVCMYVCMYMYKTPKHHYTPLIRRADRTCVQRAKISFTVQMLYARSVQLQPGLICTLVEQQQQ